MSDSDDETFLLLALEQLENETTSSTPNQTEILTSTNYQSTILNNNSDIGTLSSDKNTNFRASLLKSLKNCQSNNVALKSKNIQNSCGSYSAVKRKLENDDSKNEDIEKGELFSPMKVNKLGETEPPTYLSNNFVATHMSANVKKRKFPGPAGLLPEMGHNLIKLNLPVSETSEFTKENNNETICSQTTAQDFASGPWKEMSLDLSLLTDVNKFFKNHNIKNLSRKNPLRSQASIRKVNCIVIMIRSLDLCHHDATAVFCDQTGEIQGTISADVIEKYGALIYTGTVFVLKDVTVLSPPVFQLGVGVLGQLKKHYLTITLNSIITIYYHNEDDGSVNRVKVLTLKKEEFGALLSSTDDDNKERKELIENEENEPQINLFENIGSEKLKNSPIVLKHSTNGSNFKAPFSDPNKFTTKFNRPKVPQTSTKELNLQLEKNVNKSMQSNKKFTFNSINTVPNLPPNNINFSNIKNDSLFKQDSSCVSPSNNFKRANLPDKNVQSNIKVACNAFADSLSDDDELDTLLASIDTDTF